MHNLRYFFGAARGDAAGNVVDMLRCELLENRRFDSRGSHGVDTDAVGSYFR